MKQLRQHYHSLPKTEEHGQIILDVIKKRINYHDAIYSQTLSEVTNECERLKREIDTVFSRMQQQLKRSYANENKRLTDMKDELDNELKARKLPDSGLIDMIQRFKNELKTKVSYEFKKPEVQPQIPLSEYAVKVHMSVAPNLWVPTDIQAVILPSGDVKVTWSLEETQQKSLLSGRMSGIIKFRAEFRASGSKTPYHSIVVNGCSCTVPQSLFFGATKYHVHVRMEHKTIFSDWSPSATFRVPDSSKGFSWKSCVEGVDTSRKYVLSGPNDEIVTKLGDYCHSTVVAKGSFSRNCVTSCIIKIVNSKDDNGASMWVGVAPFSIDQNAGNANVEHCGWYLSCYAGYLSSGPPHCFNRKKYADVSVGGKFKEGKFVKNKTKIRVTFDSIKGSLEFGRNGKSLGIAFDGIPLDVPIVPVVLFYHKDDSVEISPP